MLPPYHLANKIPPPLPWASNRSHARGKTPLSASPLPESLSRCLFSNIYSIQPPCHLCPLPCRQDTGPTQEDKCITIHLTLFSYKYLSLSNLSLKSSPLFRQDTGPTQEDKWGNDPEPPTEERDYYNDRPGAQPPDPPQYTAKPSNLPVSDGVYDSVRERQSRLEMEDNAVYDNGEEQGEAVYDNKDGEAGNVYDNSEKGMDENDSGV